MSNLANSEFIETAFTEVDVGSPLQETDEVALKKSCAFLNKSATEAVEIEPSLRQENPC